MSYINTLTQQYPISEAEIKRMYLQTSFPVPFKAPELFAWVFPTPQPTHDPVTQYVVESTPILVGDTYQQAWEIKALDSETIASNLVTNKTTLIQRIDSDADVIYSAALGNRATEYQQAEEQAKSYQDAGYTGAVPAYVQTWATATGKTAQWAADNIVDTAEAWRNAQIAIRGKRLALKEKAKAAMTHVELDAIQAEWAGFVTYIKGVLGQ